MPVFVYKRESVILDLVFSITDAGFLLIKDKNLMDKVIFIRIYKFL